MTALELRASGELAIGHRLLDAARALLFLLVSLVVGIADLVMLPIAAIAGPAAVRRMLEFERALVNRLLGARVPAPPPLEPDTTLTREQLAFLAGKLPITLGASILCAIPTALFVELVAHSIQGLTASSSAYLGPWPLNPVVGLALLLLAIPALMLSVGTLEATAALISRLSRRGLSSPGGATVPVREALAQRLGDRTLAIAYWLPEPGLFVDERGRPVTLPAARGEGAHFSSASSAGPDSSALARKPRAPHGVIMLAKSLTSWLDVSTTAGGSSSRVRSNATSNPSMSGSCMSSRTIAGRSSLATASAEAPSDASPTTS